MALDNLVNLATKAKPLFKLEKLKIEAYKNIERSNLFGTFEAMFNPTSFHEKYAIQYSQKAMLGSSAPQPTYIFSKPSDLNLKLILDGTGVHEMGVLRLKRPPTVAERKKQFMDLAYDMSGKIHEPHFLRIKWGDWKFDCRLSDVKITYSSFARDGTALRAELDVTFISDVEVAKRLGLEGKNSPDVTHSRIVKSGDTLPLLCKEMYGSSAHYLRVAQANNLDDFRNLRPGQELRFPPLEPSTVSA